MILDFVIRRKIAKQEQSTNNKYAQTIYQKYYNTTYQIFMEFIVLNLGSFVKCSMFGRICSLLASYLKFRMLLKENVQTLSKTSLYF